MGASGGYGQEPDVIDVGGGYRAVNTGSTPEPALKGKNEFFGTGERMEATKWNRWTKQVDKHKLGAHYQYAVPDLPSGVAADLPAQKEHDAILADGLHKRRPGESPHPRAGERKTTMRAAFTDRSARMREGRGAKTAMMTNDPAPTEWGEHGACSCAICKPQAAPPAGQPSHEVHYNKVPRCSKDSHPTVARWEDPLSHTFNSARLNNLVQHDHTNRIEMPAQEEEQFNRNMGRKIKSTSAMSPGGGGFLSHRSFAEDGQVSAGMYDIETYQGFMPETRVKARQGWQGRSGSQPPRSGMQLIMTPRPEDPPTPTQIAASRRGDGAFKVGHSADSERIMQHFNQEMFRFADPKTPRGKSLPPPDRNSDYAGLSTGSPTQPRLDMSNPLTMRGKDTGVYSLGSHSKISPKETFRSNIGNDSSGVAFVTNHERLEQSFAAEKEWRLRTESSFATLCGQTTSTAWSSNSEAASHKERNGRMSTGVSSNLFWQE